MKNLSKRVGVVSMKEIIIYLCGTFFYTNMTGMFGNFRQSYLVNVLGLESDVVSTVNFIVQISGFIISFFCAMIIDRAPKPGHDKFKPLIKLFAIPSGLLAILMFVSPKFISAAGTSSIIIILYLSVVTILYNTSNNFAGCINSLGVVISPDTKERDGILSYRGIANAIANSAPLVVVLVLGFILPDKESSQYIASAVLCATVSTIFLIISMRVVKERVTYSSQRVNPLLGYADVLKNKYARIILVSEFLKSFRGIATYMGIFLAAALLGSTSKYILLGLPTGIGTFIGMIIVKRLLNRFNSKQIYIGSGVYSLLANTGAFLIGLSFFKNPDNIVIEVVFFIFLFLIGLQFGASNLLPSMFQADVLEDIEVKTHKRLDACLPFVIGIGATLSSTLANTVAPRILYGAGSFIQYIQPIEGVYQTQPYETKVKLLLCYTVVHGIMMLLAGVPFFFYKLTGKTREEIHAAALEYRNEVGTGANAE